MDKSSVPSKTTKKKNSCIDCRVEITGNNKRCTPCKRNLVRKSSQKYKIPCSTCGVPSDGVTGKCRKCWNLARRNQGETYHALAKEHGFTWVGSLPENNSGKTMWRCKNGHQWMACYKSLAHTTNCPKCPSVLPEEYHALAKSRGFTWVGEHVHKTRIPTMWECANGHRWMARYNGIRQGSGCPDCDRAANHAVIKDYYALAERREFIWNGEFPRSSRVKTEWQCQVGHTWLGTYKGISRGRGCPHCQKVQAADYMALATERGFIWNGKLPQRTTHPTGWECSFGHTWSARYSSVKEGSGCPHCSDIADRFTGENYHALAVRRGFLWIGELPGGVLGKTEWQCPLGHKWKASYSGINTGYGCPSCHDYENGAKSSKPQRAIFDMIGGIQNHKVGRYSLDVALQLPTANVCIEYDCWYFHGNQQERDARKTKKLIALGWKVLRIKASTMIPTLDQIQSSIYKLLAGADYAEIILPDWGKGKARQFKQA